MNEEELYAQWKAQRRSVAVPENFSTQVMNRLARETWAGPQWRGALQGRLAQISLAFGLLLLGLFRLCFMTANLLVP